MLPQNQEDGLYPDSDRLSEVDQLEMVSELTSSTLPNRHISFAVRLDVQMGSEPSSGSSRGRLVGSWDDMIPM